MARTLIIAAISSRAYVQAAVAAGYAVIAIDAFADVDTQRLAKTVIQIDVHDGQFHAQQLLDCLAEMDLSACLGFCYGAGFEAQPSLLQQIATLLPVIGNHAQALERCKNPQSFFALCDAFAMPHPKTVYAKPMHYSGWLQKTIGASGGAHIQPIFAQKKVLSRAVYYQQKIEGEPVSCLFLANGSHAQVVGFNAQWCSPISSSPYRFGGLVSNIVIDEQIQDKLTAFVQFLTQELGLKGLNSCDCIIQNAEISVLELNPRLSASVGLYQAKNGNLFASHIAACLGKLADSDSWPVADKVSRAMQVVYASRMTKISLAPDWPEWVCDIPQPDSAIAVEMPICSVIAEAHTASLARQKVLERAAACDTLVLGCLN